MSDSSKAGNHTIAVSDLVEQLGLSIPRTIRMPFDNACMTIVEGTEKALQRLREEPSLPVALIDARTRRARVKQKAALQQMARDYAQNRPDIQHSVSSRHHQGENWPSSHHGPLPVPQSASKETREILRRMALNDRTIRDPYATFSLTIDERYLPRLDVMLKINALDDDPEVRQEVLGLTRAIVDTGAHMTCISGDLISPNFLQYLSEDDSNAPYRSMSESESESILLSIQVDLILMIPNLKDFTFSCIAKVVPIHRMPNQFSGVLLGQRSFLDRMEYCLRPRVVIQAMSGDDAVDGATWGTIDIKRWVDYDNDNAIIEF